MKVFTFLSFFNLKVLCPFCTNLHHVLIDLLGVSVNQIDLFRVAVLLNLLLSGVVLVLVLHGWGCRSRLSRTQRGYAFVDSAGSSLGTLTLCNRTVTPLLTCQGTAAAGVPVKKMEASPPPYTHIHTLKEVYAHKHAHNVMTTDRKGMP